MRRVYLDHAAATPLLPEVLEAMLPYLKETFGNPSSLHSWGDGAREAIEEAREKVAALIGGSAEEIILVDSGSEANNMAIKGLAQAQRSKGNHVVVSAVEHFSVLNSVKTLEKGGFEATIVPVDDYGMVDPREVARAIRPNTTLISVMHAIGEVGTIQPVKEIGVVAREAGVLFHTDAVATAGTVPVDVKQLGVDALSLAASQFYGPKGAGALWVRKGVRIIPLIDGGEQEGGRRAGTYDVPGLVGMGKAAELALRDMEARTKHLDALSRKLIDGVLGAMERVILTGHPSRRIPGNASFCVEFIEGESLLMMLDSQGVAAASGSACTSRALKTSHVLTAMGIPPEAAQGSVLFTPGMENTGEDIDYLLEIMPPVVKRLRDMSPLYSKFVKGRRGGA